MQYLYARSSGNNLSESLFYVLDSAAIMYFGFSGKITEIAESMFKWMLNDKPITDNAKLEAIFEQYECSLLESRARRFATIHNIQSDIYLFKSSLP